MQKNLLLVNSLIFIFVLAAIGWGSQVFIYPTFSKLILDVEAAEANINKIPPQITDITVATTTATSTTIVWKTDRPADSMINYNVSQDYGVVRKPATTTSHSITIENLVPSQLYYFRILSSDANGNQSISNDLTFGTAAIKMPEDTTPAAPIPTDNPRPPGNARGAGQEDGSGKTNATNDVKQDTTQLSPEQQAIVDKVIQLINQTTGEVSLQAIQDELVKAAGEKIAAPVITSDFAKVVVTTDAAQISWQTDKEANSMVHLVEEANYNPKAANPYTWSQGNADAMVKDHQVIVRGLKPATTYHFRVSSKSELNLQSISSDNTFRTKSILPEIYNAVISKIQEDQATIEFTTNVPCTSVIDYKDLMTDTTKLAGSPVLVTTHSIVLTDLKFDTYYQVLINVENEQNEKTVSPPMTFTTVRDIVPPVITSVKAKSNLDQGSDNTQTIISWHTDEPAICQMLYKSSNVKNADTASAETNTKNKDTDYVLNHVQVVTDFKMASVYRYWIDCSDKTGNKARSDDYTILTPVREQSILDIILKNFEGSFGWLKKK